MFVSISAGTARRLSAMVGWEDVRRLALALPATSEESLHDLLSWRVANKLFVWERPLRGPDLKALGEAAPAGPLLGARVADEGEKFAIIDAEPEIFLTTPHFNGYPAVLAQLEKLSLERLAEVIEEAWLARAPKRARAAYLADR